MNLVQAIHQRWAATPALNALLPASRVYTGLSFNPARPLAIISKESDKPATCHSDGSAINTVILRIQVFHDHYDAGLVIVDQIKTAFEHASFALSGSDKVLNIKHSNDSEQQNNNGTWQFIVDLKCTVYLASGV